MLIGWAKLEFLAIAYNQMQEHQSIGITTGLRTFPGCPSVSECLDNSQSRTNDSYKRLFFWSNHNVPGLCFVQQNSIAKRSDLTFVGC